MSRTMARYRVLVNARYNVRQNKILRAIKSL